MTITILDAVRPFYYLVLNVFTSLINLFIKRDRSIILMGSWYGYRFGGNSRFLFQYLSEKKEKYNLSKVIWVTRSQEIYDELIDMGYEVYIMTSWKGIYYHLKAGIHAISVNTTSSSATSKNVKGDILGELSGGAIKLHLNHGIAEAKANRFLEYNNLNIWNKAIVNIYNFLHSLYFFRHFMLYPGGWDKMFFLSGSEENTRIQKRRHIKTERTAYIDGGLPEMCDCLKYTRREDEVIKIIQSKEKTILYVPTYRTNPNTGYQHPLNSAKLCDFLRRNGYLWIDKLHPGAQELMNAKEYDPEFTLKLETEFDINVIIRDIDILITDYSTVFYKAIYFDKPIIYYMEDYEGYVHKDKSVVSGYRDGLVGIQVENIDELLFGLEKCFLKEYFMENKEKYEEKKQIYFDGKIVSYESICDDLFQKIEEL